MATNYNKTSLLIPSQIPEYIRDDPSYDNFVAFLQSYYEWLEQEGNVTDRAKNLLNYADIDKTTNEFISYFTNEFLQYFPEEILIDKRTAVKFAKELYQSKGTLSAYKLLFRVLYNSDVDVYFTKDAILRASDGIWYVEKYLNVLTDDIRFLDTINYRIFGEESKALATIENSVVDGNKIKIFISNMQRSFRSGEYIRIVNDFNQDIIINGENLRAKIIGQVYQIDVDPNNRGKYYNVGDPVVVYGGLYDVNGLGAKAQVGSVSSGSIKSISVVNGGYGYRPNPNTIININVSGASATVSSVDTDPDTTSNVTLFPTDSIQLHKNTQLGAASYGFAAYNNANANSTLFQSLSFVSFSTYPISSVFLSSGGIEIESLPTITADSIVNTDYTNALIAANSYYANTYAYITSLGILAKPIITNPGSGYSSTDTITISGGSGYGAYANITVSGGQIVAVDYVNGSSNNYCLGGMGYRSSALPTVTINTSTGAGGSIVIPGILGEGASFLPQADGTGRIQTVVLTQGGEDYIATPNVSFKVQDLAVNNIIIDNNAEKPETGDIIYQGVDLENSTYMAYVDSLLSIKNNINPLETIYRLRVYNYSSSYEYPHNIPDPNSSIKIYNKTATINLTNANAGVESYFPYNPDLSVLGVNVYAKNQPTALGTAKFINGLFVSEGRYINTQGHPSSYSILQDDNHNGFTYVLTVEKEIAKYREMLLNLLHPSGLKVLGKYVIISESNFDTHSFDFTYGGQPLRYYANTDTATATMVADFTNKSNNIIKFNNLAGANIAEFITANDTIIELIPTNGPNVKSEVISVNLSSNTVVLNDNVWLTFANVATVSATAGQNTINIVSLTGTYDLINNGDYSDANLPLKDIVFAGDTVKVNNQTKIVSSVDYANGIITLTTNLTYGASSNMSVNRTVLCNSSPVSDQVIIWHLIDYTNMPALIDGYGNKITTQDGSLILI